jgi:hypothetical protein
MLFIFRIAICKLLHLYVSCVFLVSLHSSVRLQSWNFPHNRCLIQISNVPLLPSSVPQNDCNGVVTLAFLLYFFSSLNLSSSSKTFISCLTRFSAHPVRAKCGGVPDPEAATVMSQPVVRLLTADSTTHSTTFTIRGLLGQTLKQQQLCLSLS